MNPSVFILFLETISNVFCRTMFSSKDKVNRINFVFGGSGMRVFSRSFRPQIFCLHLRFDIPTFPDRTRIFVFFVRPNCDLLLFHCRSAGHFRIFRQFWVANSILYPRNARGQALHDELGREKAAGQGHRVVSGWETLCAPLDTL